MAILLITPMSTHLSAAELGEEVTFGNWYLRGDLRAAILLDTVHNDASFSVARTEVFGDDGSDSPRENSDNRRIPTDLDNEGVTSSRDLAGDLPELGFTLLGSRIALGTEGPNYKVVFELGLINPENPYALDIHRLWLEYGSVGIGLGWSTFMDFKKDERDGSAGGYSPYSFDYIGLPGFAYQRQLALRFQLSPKWYLGLEQPQDLVYRGYDHGDNGGDTKNDDFAGGQEDLIVPTSGDSYNVYKVSRQLRDRHFLPNLVFTYYGADNKHNVFASLLLQHIKLDNNAPLLLESDPGYAQLIADAEGTGNLEIRRKLDEQLGINDDLSGGLDSLNFALNLGLAGPMGRNGNNGYNLAYIYNGGRYLRDNPNPSHLVVKKNNLCLVDCDYKLVNVASHSYLVDFRFSKNIGLAFSGTVTDDDYGIELGGAATKQVHSTYFNYRKPFASVKGLSSVYELAHSYRQTFNTRHNSAYPRIRFSYGIGYNF
ncbi:MAG: hypothetical protein K0U41_09625 [Gammaproteobacteria bacterium]|nr:hypothetical protein [Gammaproteobacteria bacterium]